jgi:hypothetical protein
MDQEIARLRPAQIVTTERVPLDVPTLPRREYISRTFHQRQALVAEVHRLARRREIGTTYRIRQVAGGWVAEVVRIREPGRRWGRVAAWGIGTLAVAAGLLWLAVLALQALAALLPYLIAGAVVLAILAAVAGGTLRGGISVSQSVNIK